MTLISADNNFALMAALFVIAGGAFLAERTRIGSHLTGAVIAILAAMLLPALSRACQEKAAMDQSSPRPATRMISSSVVLPRSTRRTPADWMLSVLVRAWESISCSPAPECMRLCSVASMPMYS